MSSSLPLITLALLDEIQFELRVDRKEIETIWSLGHYDGPAVGIVRWKKDGRLYLADCQNLHNRYENKRRFWMIDIGDESIAKLVAWSEERAKHYGNACAWTAHGQRNPAVTIRGDFDNLKSEAWQRNNPQPRVDWYELPVVGYFDGWRYTPEGE